ncbi:MAG: TonB-dependent receptor [Burkholderiales bacterium]|nr:TonB-dependent receptor [Burkholderiales bacterium]
MFQPHARRRRSVLATALALLPLTAAAQSSDIDAPPVKVTVDRLQITRDQASVPVQVITREELDKLAVRTIPGALALLPNVSVQNTGSLFDEGTVQMYGISGQGRAPTRNVVAINGVPLNNGMFPETSLNMIPFNLVERIEVIQGPGSSAYGNNAFTGVINIVTRQPEKFTAGITSLFATRWNASDNSAWFGTGSEDGSWFTGSVQQRETLGSIQPGGAENFSDSRLKNLSLLGEKRFGDTSISASYLRYEFDRHNPGMAPAGTPAGPTASEERGFRDHLNVGLKHRFAEQWEGELRLTRNEYSIVAVQNFNPTAPLGPANEDRSGNGVLGRLTWTTGSNILEVGYDYADARLVNNLATGAAQKVFTGTSNGVYVQDRLLLLNNQLSLSAGYRYDWFDFYDQSSNSGKVGFSFKPNGAVWLVRGNIGRSFSAPAFNQLFNTSVPWGNRSLTAETLTLAELGGEITPIDRLTLGITAFTAKHKDPIFPRTAVVCAATNPAALPNQNRFCNVSPAPEYWGTTFTADWAFAAGWNVGTSYTYTDPKAVDGSTFTFHSNKHQFKALLSYTAERFSIGANLQYAEGRYWGDNFSNPADRYTLVNLSGTYKVTKNLSLLAQFYNVLNEDYATRADRAGGNPERFFPVPQPRAYAMLGVSYQY